MTEPVDREAMRALSVALRAWHKTLLESALEAELGSRQGVSAFALFQVAAHDPSLQWLQPLTSLLAELDASLSPRGQRPRKGWEADLTGRLEALLAGQGEHAAFRARMAALTETDPRSAIGLAEVRRALATGSER